MDRYRLPHACLLCHPIALPFRSFWEARRHVLDDHADIVGDRHAEEFLRILCEEEAPPEPVRVEDEPPFRCLHCAAIGRLEFRNTVADINVHWRNTHCDKEFFNRMGVPIPFVSYGEDYLSERDYIETQERLLAKFERQLESIQTATDFFTELNLGFFHEAPDGAENVREEKREEKKEEEPE